MLSVFPELFNYSQIAPLILRIALALIIVQTAFLFNIKSPYRREKITGFAKISAGIFVFLGIFTQPIAIIIALLILFETLSDKLKKNIVAPEKKLLNSLIFAISVSLIFSGPGLLSIDLPL